MGIHDLKNLVFEKILSRFENSLEKRFRAVKSCKAVPPPAGAINLGLVIKWYIVGDAHRWVHLIGGMGVDIEGDNTKFPPGS